MKRVGWIVLLLTLIWTLMPVNADSALQLIYQSETQTITVAGTVEGQAGYSVDIVLVEGESTLEQLDSGAVQPIIFDTTRLDSKNSFQKDILLGEGRSGGMYTVYAVCNEKIQSGSFILINEGDAANALLQINAAQTVSETNKIFGENHLLFGITEEEFDAAEELISAIVFYQKPASGYGDATAVYQKAKSAVIIENIKNSSGSLEELLKANEVILGIDSSSYGKLTEAAAQEMDRLLRQADYETEAFARIYEDSLVVATISKAQSWISMKEAVLLYAQELGIQTQPGSAYDEIDYKDQIFQSMFKKDLSSVERIRDSFNSAVQEAGENQKESAGGGSSGGGGGGSSGGGSSSKGTTVAQIDTPTAVEAIEQSVFPDVPASHWAKASIGALYRMGVITGFEDGNFHPDEPVTRAQFVKLLTQAFSISGQSEESFADVESGQWYYDYVQSAAGAGLISGYNGYFYPENTITRQDAVLIVYRVLTAQGETLEGSQAFADQDKIAPYAVQAVGAMAKNGLIQGKENGFEPETTLTRAESAKLIFAALEYRK